MIRPISNIYLIVNGQSINVGKVICECDQGSWFNKHNEYITNTEWEERKKKFEIGDQRIGDLVFHCKGEFKNNIALKPIEQKWIDELINMGYQVKDKLVYEIKEN